MKKDIQKGQRGHSTSSMNSMESAVVKDVAVPGKRLGEIDLMLVAAVQQTQIGLALRRSLHPTEAPAAQRYLATDSNRFTSNPHIINQQRHWIGILVPQN
jgi:hypothetical protein